MLSEVKKHVIRQAFLKGLKNISTVNIHNENMGYRWIG